jgi:hypothetical protein
MASIGVSGVRSGHGKRRSLGSSIGSASSNASLLEVDGATGDTSGTRHALDQASCPVRDSVLHPMPATVSAHVIARENASVSVES